MNTHQKKSISKEGARLSWGQLSFLLWLSNYYTTAGARFQYGFSSSFVRLISKSVLAQKKEHLLLCQKLNDMRIEIADLKEEYLLIVPYKFEEDNVMSVYHYIQSIWSPEQQLHLFSCAKKC